MTDLKVELRRLFHQDGLEVGDLFLDQVVKMAVAGVLDRRLELGGLWDDDVDGSVLRDFGVSS